MAAEAGKDESGELDGYLMAHRGGEAGEKHSGRELGKTSRSSCESRDRKKSLFGEWNGSWPRVGCQYTPQASVFRIGKAGIRDQRAGGRKRRCRRCKWSAAEGLSALQHSIGRIDTIVRGSKQQERIKLCHAPICSGSVDMKTPNCPAETLIMADPRCISSSLRCQPP